MLTGVRPLAGGKGRSWIPDEPHSDRSVCSAPAPGTWRGGEEGERHFGPASDVSLPAFEG